MYKPRFNSLRREALWFAERLRARNAGRGGLPICNICDLPVAEIDAWDESHHPAHPKVFGGRSVGIAHHRCNLEHGAKMVTPAKAKADRVRRFHIGAAGPGLGRFPMRGGRRDRIRKTMNRGVVERLSSGERHAATLAELTLTAADGKPVGVWADRKRD